MTEYDDFHDTCRERIAELEDRLATCQKERDLKTGSFQVAVLALRSISRELATIEFSLRSANDNWFRYEWERDLLKAGLRDYGRNKPGCSCFGDEVVRVGDCANCDCGLAELLR